MAGLWRNNKETPEGKYLVKRRDGTIPEWPSFVIGAKDPAAPEALRSYARAAFQLGMDPEYCAEVMGMAEQFEQYRAEHGTGEPDSGHDVIDDFDTVVEMRHGKSA